IESVVSGRRRLQNSDGVCPFLDGVYGYCLAGLDCLLEIRVFMSRLPQTLSKCSEMPRKASKTTPFAPSASKLLKSRKERI
ncbi:hypothetical protein Tco_0852679, partial [Tanacetum coccineum]